MYKPLEGADQVGASRKPHLFGLPGSFLENLHLQDLLIFDLAQSLFSGKSPISRIFDRSSKWQLFNLPAPWDRNTSCKYEPDQKEGGWEDLGNVIVISSSEKLWEYLKIFLDFLKVT